MPVTQPPRWWDPQAAEDAIASFLPTLSRVLAAAYRRAGSPHGAAAEYNETIERWLEDIKGTPEREALETELQDAWAFHLQVRFAARQTN